MFYNAQKYLLINSESLNVTFIYDLKEVKSSTLYSLSLEQNLLFMLNKFSMACYTFAMVNYGADAWKDPKGPTKNDKELCQVTMKGGEYVIGDEQADTHADVHTQDGRPLHLSRDPKGERGLKGDTPANVDKTQVDVIGIFTPSSNSKGEVASVPLPCREDCHEDPSASHVHGGANATDTREEADNSGGTDNLQLRGNVRQVHPASKWDRVSGQVPHFQQHNSPSHSGQVQHQKDPYRVQR